jgi:hypothetical protein
MPVINNVTFLYTKIQSPVPAFNKVDTEFCVDVVLSKADAKALGKEYPKQKPKAFDNDEFVEKFKIDPPYPDQDEQFILKLKKAHTKGGKQTPEQYFPRVFVETEDGNVDQTYEVLVSNGSTGKASYRVKETDSYGNFIELQSILVQNLIPYVSKSGGVGAEFGVTQLAEVPANQRVVNKQTDVQEDEAPKKPVKAKKEPESEEMDSSPF